MILEVETIGDHENEVCINLWVVYMDHGFLLFLLPCPSSTSFSRLLFTPTILITSFFFSLSLSSRLASSFSNFFLLSTFLSSFFSFLFATLSFLSARICWSNATASRSSGSITTARFWRYVCDFCFLMSFGLEAYGRAAWSLWGMWRGLNLRAGRSIFLYVELTLRGVLIPWSRRTWPVRRIPVHEDFSESNSEVTGL